MPRDYLDRLLEEHDTHLAAIDEIVNRALTEDRDVTPDEDAECTRHQEAVTALAPQIKRWTGLRETRATAVINRDQLPPAMVAPSVQVVERAADPDPASGAEIRVFRTAGEMAHAMMRAGRGDMAAREQVQRALAKNLTGDVPGLLPVQYVGDIRNRISAVRPICASGRQAGLPAAGMEFRRPKITQHTLVGVQTTQKTELASQKLTVNYDTISLATYGGAVNMSIQAVERTDPAALQLVYEDLASQYGYTTEGVAAAKFDALTPDAGAIDITTATADDFLAAVYTGVGKVYTDTRGKTPDVIYAGMGWFPFLGKITKPVNPQNGVAEIDPGVVGFKVGNLRAILSPQLSTNFLAVGVADALEVYEQPGSPVQLKALEVGILGYEVGVYGLFAAEVWPDHFVRLDEVTGG